MGSASATTREGGPLSGPKEKTLPQASAVTPKDQAMPRRSWWQCRGGQRVLKYADRVFAVVILLLIWQLASSFGSSGTWISTPPAVAERFWDMLLDGSLQINLFQTLEEALVGLAGGALIGTLLGLVLGSSRRLSSALDPILMGLYSLPKVSLAPLFIIWFGIGLVAKVALVISMVMFIFLYNVGEGLKSIDPDIIDAFRCMRASRWTMLRYVTVPSLLPWLMTATRIGIGLSLIGAVVAELVGSSRGLGWYVSNATATYDITGSITALVVLGVVATLLNTILAKIEAHVMRWRARPLSDR